MEIRLLDNGTWLGIVSDTEAHELTAEEKVLYADQINVIKDSVANWGDTGLRTKAIITALVKVINQRLPAGQKITASELKQAIKDEL